MSSCGDLGLYLAVMVFNDDYGKCELTRAPMSHVLRLAADVLDHGVCLGPTHVEGAAIRWVSFRDGSLRASIHDGEVRILPYGEDRYVLLHVRRGSVYPLALGTDRGEIVDRLERELHSFADSPNSIAVHFRGQRHNFKATLCGDGFARCTIGDTTFIVSLEDSGADELSPNLVVERVRSGTRERLVEQPYNDHLDILWTEDNEVRPGRAAPHYSRTRPGRAWPLVSANPTPGAANTPLPPESKAALTGVLEHIARLDGAGISIRRQGSTILDHLAEKCVRAAGKGDCFRSAIESGAEKKFIGKERAFRYGIALYRVFGLVRSDGVQDVLPLDALRDLGAEYTRALLDTWSRIQASSAGAASAPRSSTSSPPPQPHPPEQGTFPQPDLENRATFASDARTGMNPSLGGIPLSFATRKDPDAERGSTQPQVRFDDEALFFQKFVDAHDEAKRERERQLGSMHLARPPPWKGNT